MSRKSSTCSLPSSTARSFNHSLLLCIILCAWNECFYVKVMRSCSSCVLVLHKGLEGVGNDGTMGKGLRRTTVGSRSQMFSMSTRLGAGMIKAGPRAYSRDTQRGKCLLQHNMRRIGLHPFCIPAPAECTMLRDNRDFTLTHHCAETSTPTLGTYSSLERDCGT